MIWKAILRLGTAALLVVNLKYFATAFQLTLLSTVHMGYNIPLPPTRVERRVDQPSVDYFSKHANPERNRDGYQFPAMWAFV